MGGVSSRLDYPLKDSLCVAWHILLLFLAVNAFVKQAIIFRRIRKIRTPYHNTIYNARQHKKRFRYDTLPMEDKDKYLMQYQDLIYQRLCKIVPKDIAFFIVGYYIPNNFIYSRDTLKQTDNTITLEITTDRDDTNATSPTQELEQDRDTKRTAKQMQKHVALSSTTTTTPSTNQTTAHRTVMIAKPFDPHQPFTNFTTFQNWCNANNQDDDIDRKDWVEDWKQRNTGRRNRRARHNLVIHKFGEQSMTNLSQIMDRWYLPEHNKQYQDLAMEATVKEAKEGDHKWRLIETVYVIFKNFCLLITTVIFITAFMDWKAVEPNNYLRFIGFILLFHHHPSVTSVHMMRWVKLDYNKYGYGVWPCASPGFVPLVMYLERNNERETQHTPKRLYYDAQLKWFTMFNHWIGTYGIWLISLPFVFGGGFWFTHIIWLVYLCLGILLCLLGGIFHYSCGRLLRGMSCNMRGVGPGALWFIAFFYHTTGIMYIIGFVFHDRSWPAFVEISTGTYCNGGVMSLDMSDARVLFILLAWIL